ncbi:MAG: AraC family transcriptional regulator [Haliea sp.]|nr:MAG: AraC family transcriptional regulator [Haliea sp.]
MDADTLEYASLAGLRVEVVETRGGTVGLAPVADHRIRVHSGAPVRGLCGAQRFVYSQGDVDIVVPGQADSWQEEGPARSVVLRFAPALLERTAHELGLPAGRAGLGPRHQLRDARIEHIAMALEADWRSGAAHGRLFAQSLGTALAAHLVGRYTLARRVPASLSAVQRRRVVAYIEERLDQDLSLTVLAAVAHSSVSHFKTLFKRSMGVAVHEYVVQRRVERARALLVHGRLPASQVALEAGFSHQSHMARSMRRVLGLTPAMLRRGPVDGE